MSNKRSRESIVDLTLQEAVRNAEDDILLSESKSRVDKINEALSKFSDEELARFEYYMRSHLRKNKVKDILNENLGAKFNVTDEMCIAVGGLAKLFVGELMHYSMEVLEQQQDTSSSPSSSSSSSLRMEHIEEAVFRMKKEGKIGHASEDAFLFSKRNIKSESLSSELMQSELFMDDDDDNDNNNDNNNSSSSTSKK